MLGVEYSADLEKQGRIAGGEIQACSAAAELVAVGFGSCQLACYAAVSEPE